MTKKEKEAGLFFKIYGLAVDTETGEKTWAYAKLIFNKNTRNAANICQGLYDEYVNDDDKKQRLLESCRLDKLFTIADMVMITKDEYYIKTDDDIDDS